ncbi:MAG: succinate dehydrogenase, hydrophobic membrane anchor protein [Zoogloeaceae bacterium]|nr:succinate dehydrogenase, hydrophobic membrane anchor protein [Zoogloeaceae bacterium]
MIHRIVVGAHYGLKDWLAQRVTAIIMAAYSLFLAIVLAAVQPVSFEAWRNIFTFGPVKFFTFVFGLSLLLHAWIGIRDLWMDYVQPVSVRLTLHVLTIVALIGYVGWFVTVLWRV